MPERKAPPKKDDFIAQIVKDPKQPPDVLLLTGFMGPSSEDGYTRLYFDAQLSDYVEIPDAAILHTLELTKEQSPLGGSYVWIQRDAELIHGKVGAGRPKAKFFEGRIQQEYMGGAPYGGAGVPYGYGPAPRMPITIPAPICQTDFGPRCPPQTDFGPRCPPQTDFGPRCPPQTIPDPRCWPPTPPDPRCGPPTPPDPRCWPPTPPDPRCVLPTTPAAGCPPRTSPDAGCTDYGPRCPTEFPHCPTYLCVEPGQIYPAPYAEQRFYRPTLVCPQTALCPVTQDCPRTQFCPTQFCPQTQYCPSLACPTLACGYPGGGGYPGM